MQVQHPKFNGKKITVMGLGLHGGGVGTAKFLVRQGAKVTVTDLKTKKELASSLKKLKGLPIRFVLGKHDSRDFKNADMVVYNPGVRTKFLRLEDSPHLATAMRHHVPLETDIGIFFQLVPRDQIIGITGSKGKSTTATLIAHILKQKYPHTLLAGNIRTSVLDILPKIKPSVPIILELSNWQLEGLAANHISPHVAVVTNILHEHLNTYRSFHAYTEVKKHILRFQKKNDVAVLNKDLKKFKEFQGSSRKARRIWFSKRTTPALYADVFKLPGFHNRANLASALVVAKIYRVGPKKIRRALETFRGLEGRIETVKKVGGVTFVNDTTATMPDAVIAALRTFPDPRNLILIAGGVDKKFNFRPLGEILKICSIKAIVFLPGTATVKMLSVAKKYVIPQTKIREAGSMKEAVNIAWRYAEKGDTILLSPGAASFNLFQNEFDRGEQFVREVKKLKPIYQIQMPKSK
ncbi:MAG: UDP-N-acetylmuramoyl-L-alanine--D-glutamate ligase [bacterium]|nr:UDP-N-acetylmuramoyl-L-alanine--D-glutamate ligase [bacterium]